MGFRDSWIEAGRPLPRETSKFNTRLGFIQNAELLECSEMKMSEDYVKFRWFINVKKQGNFNNL